MSGVTQLPGPPRRPGGPRRGYSPDRRLCGDRRRPDRGAGRAGRVDRLAVPARPRLAERFAAVLDADRGGRFALQPEFPAEMKRRYRPDTNVLETTFTTGQGVVRVTDAWRLPSSELGPTRELIRRVDGVAGRVPMRWRITPAFGYGAMPPRLERRGGIPVAIAGSRRAGGLLLGRRRGAARRGGDLRALRGPRVQLGGDRPVRSPPGAAGLPERDSTSRRVWKGRPPIGEAGPRSAPTTGRGAKP